MIRVLLDTDHVSLHERGHLPLRVRLTSFLPEEVAVSVVTVEEVLRSTIPVVPFDMACEQQYQALRAMRLRVGSRDLCIAATALVQNVVLITRNRRDFEQVPGLRLDDWSQ